MRLNDLLPNTYEYNHEEIAIDLSFDNVLDVLDILTVEGLYVHNIAELSLELLFGEGVIEPDDYIEVWNDVFTEFISDDPEDEYVEYDLNGDPMPQKEAKQTISLEKDAEYIYSSFRQAYQINLFEEQTKLHWYEFKGLLAALPEDTVMKQIIKIRSYEPSENDSKEYKKEMLKLQDVYSLDDEEVDE